ncbi:glycoside hydrolase family 55 protein [Ferruginibacter sp. HRS2-29]|uniref:glycoside hydrolase family 55 protein n=1 Tax=Ferruginibacter sp. HRS2-29 TaxID=2487334 RepID=UPI0020CD70DA|nr:glycoside hydrolase family 55 protein [Ferruginibacter sp. HRS2-29]MCP9750715.1 hypothetical protein [Ferruginibacter sp. HRS2-29]
MKKIFSILFLSSAMHCGAQVSILDGMPRSSSDVTIILQQEFNRQDVSTVVIGRSAMEINGTVKIPAGKTLRFEPGCRLTGKGTIEGGIIDAGYQQFIFDTTLTINPQAVNGYFSAKWFGAKGSGTDDHAAIQKSINTCIRNNIRTVFIPVGRYTISKPLILRGPGKDNARGYCTLEILGESSFWDSNLGTEINPSFTNGFAFGIHRGKGCKIRKMRINGKFTPPNKNDKMKFYNTAFEDFKDGVCRDNRNSPYAAIVIDPFTNIAGSELDAANYYPGLGEYYGTNGNSRQSGSTGTEIEEVNINGFVVGICSSPNGVTRNAEITIINKIQFSNCKLCISGGQDQEKANVISNIYCWGGTHTIFGTDLYGGKRMAGNWDIDHVNIAGGVVRFIYNDQHGYFSTSVNHVYAESLGSWGMINSDLACEIANCNVDFEYPETAGTQTLITSCGKNVVYRSCNFRYYGRKNTPLRIAGNAVYERCFFSGPVENGKKNGTSFMIPFLKLPVAGTQLLCGLIILALLLLIVQVRRMMKKNKTSGVNKQYFIVSE